MFSEHNIVAICYDFDGTLAPGNMQEYGLIQSLELSVPEFWARADKLVSEDMIEPGLAYLKSTLDRGLEIGRVELLSEKALMSCGANIKYFPGVENWFDDIRNYAAEKGIKSEHYLISSGQLEILNGANIIRYFKKIYASSYYYNAEGVPVWPKRSVNYTTKTQYLYRISKGVNNIADNTKVNKVVPDAKRRIPFRNMAYIGDGLTDIPCMQVVKDGGGLSIAVYDPSNQNAKKACDQLVKDNRVHLGCEADYTQGGKLYGAVTRLIDNAAEQMKNDGDYDETEEPDYPCR